MALPSTILSHIIFFSDVEPSFLANIFIQKYLIVNFLYCAYLLLLLLFLFTVIFFRNKLCSRELICLLIIGITNLLLPSWWLYNNFLFYYHSIYI